MSEEVKEILRRELEELKQNKIRVIALGVCFIILMIFWINDDSSDGEEILLTEESTPITKDLPVTILPVKNPDGIKIVMGANADRLFIGDPFAGEEMPEPEPPPPLPPILAPSTEAPPPTLSRQQSCQKKKFSSRAQRLAVRIRWRCFCTEKKLFFSQLARKSMGEKFPR